MVIELTIVGFSYSARFIYSALSRSHSRLPISHSYQRLGTLSFYHFVFISYACDRFFISLPILHFPYLISIIVFPPKPLGSFFPRAVSRPLSRLPISACNIGYTTDHNSLPQSVTTEYIKNSPCSYAFDAEKKIRVSRASKSD